MRMCIKMTMSSFKWGRFCAVGTYVVLVCRSVIVVVPSWSAGAANYAKTLHRFCPSSHRSCSLFELLRPSFVRSKKAQSTLKSGCKIDIAPYSMLGSSGRDETGSRQNFAPLRIQIVHYHWSYWYFLHSNASLAPSLFVVTKPRNTSRDVWCWMKLLFRHFCLSVCGRVEKSPRVINFSSTR